MKCKEAHKTQLQIKASVTFNASIQMYQTMNDLEKATEASLNASSRFQSQIPPELVSCSLLQSIHRKCILRTFFFDLMILRIIKNIFRVKRMKLSIRINLFNEREFFFPFQKKDFN